MTRGSVDGEGAARPCGLTRIQAEAATTNKGLLELFSLAYTWDNNVTFVAVRELTIAFCRVSKAPLGARGWEPISAPLQMPGMRRVRAARTESPSFGLWENPGLPPQAPRCGSARPVRPFQPP